MTEQLQKPVASYDPKKEPIGQLLSLTNPSITVPNWQRNYSWKTEHVETFWNDLAYFLDKEGAKPTGEYFLGSVVIVRTAAGEYELLDGQQRLATSAILLSVIRDLVKDYKPEAAVQLQTQYLVGHDHVEEKTIHKMRLNLYDRQFFQAFVLQERDGDYEAPTPKIASHKLIKNTRDVFERELEALLEGLEPKDRFERAMLVSRCLLKHMTVISVYSSDEDSAAEVFETLNDRGIGLSTPDLLRNLIIRRTHENQRADVVDLWRDVVSFESDNAIKNFLRHYWVSRYGDVKSQSLYREIKTVIEKNDIKSVDFSKSLSLSAENYKQIISANTDDAKFNDVLLEVKEFGASASLLTPAFLGLLEVVGNEQRAACARTLLNVFVRHSVIVNRENSQLENVVYAATRDLRTTEDHDGFRKALVESAPTDGETNTAFERLSLTHNGSRRSILKRFELELRGTEELDVANPSRVHVEHIYPQSPEPGERWENHARLVNRLGNLTLLSARLNKSIKNGNFDKKKPSFLQSEIQMTLAVAKNVGWSPQLMESRQADMAKKAANLWPI